ncbi:MAG TPA: P-II family nitrogen regulator [Verrucomicrobiae bacterium]|nr:P-II family nitrogen regulator [Verrucomicrobiae bacterium]
MKKIEAIIRPEKLELLRQHLEKIGYPGMMVTKMEGHGKQGGVTHQFRGTEYKTSFLPKLRIEIVVTDAQVKKLSDAIVEVCRSGSVGDGKIFISSVENTIRIRTGESGEAAV